MHVVRAPLSVNNRLRRLNLGPPVWLLGLGGSGMMVLGSLAFRTTRQWGMSGMSEGAGRWAGWTFLLGLAAGALFVLGGALLTSDVWRQWSIPVFACAAVASYAGAWMAWTHFDRLLAERDRERDYVLHIAAGLPVVVTAGSVAGSVAILILAAVGWKSILGRRQGLQVR